MSSPGGLGRRFDPDERDERFLMRRRLMAAADIKLPTSKTHRISTKSLNQRKTGACVGHAWKNFLRCAPIQTEGTKAPSAFDIYRAAVKSTDFETMIMRRNFRISTKDSTPGRPCARVPRQ